MRRLVALLLAVCSLALVTGPARAQSPSPEPGPSVRLRLLEQSFWNGPRRPVLSVRFLARNEGEAPLDELTIGLTLFARVRSRTAYEASLIADPLPVIVVDAETYAVEGMLEPGTERSFEVAFPLDAPGIDPTSSGIYPVKLDLRSEGVPVAAIRTPVVYLVRRPEQPLGFAWTFVLHEPPGLGPDGAFTSTSLEEAIAPEGPLTRAVNALVGLERTTPTPVDVVVSPLLLLQLERMREGYVVRIGEVRREVAPGEGGSAGAAEVLAGLRALAAAPAVELSTMPYAAPEVPSLLASGLAHDLDVQLAKGRELVAGALGAAPGSTIMRPPGGALDPASVDALAARGIRTLVLDAGVVTYPAHPLGFAPPPTAALGDRGEVVGLTPDPAVAAFLTSPLTNQDPVLAAHALLGELAAIWQEQPGLPRGVAMLLTEPRSLPGSFVETLIAGVADAPWLAPMSAGALVESFPPVEPEAFTPPTPRTFPAAYVGELKQARRKIETYRSMLTAPSDEPDRLEDLLLLAESGTFLTDPGSGAALIAAADERASSVLDAVRVDAGQVVTLTSRTGATLPVRVASSAAVPLRVTVTLASSHLVRPVSRDIVLQPRADQTLTFDVDLKTTGRFDVQVEIRAPNGRTIAQTSVVVRSTAYNRIALLITLAAALVLVLLWARRFLPRPRT